VTARPPGDAGAAPASTQPTASPTPADTLSEDGTDEFDETVPAGKSVTVPIDYEGSTWGSLTGLGRAAGLAVTLRGKPLSVEKGTGVIGTNWWFGESGENPANGDLVIKNTTGSPIEVVGFVMIYTRRHLSIAGVIQKVRKGQGVSFDISLTQATDADDVTAWSIADGQTTAPVRVTKVATGHWTGWATFSAGGDYEIHAKTAQSHMRAATNFVSVAAEDVTLSPSFAEQVTDSDNDGLINKLVLTPTITVPVAGEYMANATLFDQAGVEVTTNFGHGALDLTAGSQPIDLEFDGSLIYKSGRWGPYTLHVAVVYDSTPHDVLEIADAVLGQTKAYDYMQFQRERVAIDWSALTSKAVDADGDGKFEQLQLNGFVTVETAGEYDINAGLYADSQWDHVAGASITVRLSSGRNLFTLVFKGSDIAGSGRDGPYVAGSFNCYLTRGVGFQLLSQPTRALTTIAYKATQFGG
jgi:hypothetical protein